MQSIKTLHYLGNKKILNNYKVGFLCSRKVPADIILKTYDWAIEQRDKGVCVVSGFHSKIEKDVFHYLAKGTQPMILVLARGMYKRIPKYLQLELDKDRLLIISPFKDSYRRITKENAAIRNEYIIEISDEIFTPYINPNGLLYNLFQEKGIKPKTIHTI